MLILCRFGHFLNYFLKNLPEDQKRAFIDSNNFSIEDQALFDKVRSYSNYYGKNILSVGDKQWQQPFQQS
jgi:hypothetical protein